MAQQMMNVDVARIIEISEDTDEPTGWTVDHVSPASAHDIASRLYVGALKANVDVYYKVELYAIRVKATAPAMLKLANSLKYNVERY